MFIKPYMIKRLKYRIRLWMRTCKHRYDEVKYTAKMIRNIASG